MNFCQYIKAKVKYFMSTNHDIKIGSTVRDDTGFTGIAVQRLDFLSGNVQYIIQPRMTEGDKGYPDAVGLDFHQLDVIDAGTSAKTIEPPPIEIQLGQRVEDLATGFTGIATCRSTYQNGCVSFLVVPKVQNGTAFNENPRGDYIDHKRLKVVDDGLLAQITPAEPDPETGKRRGGPPTRMRQTSRTLSSNRLG